MEMLIAGEGRAVLFWLWDPTPEEPVSVWTSSKTKPTLLPDFDEIHLSFTQPDLTTASQPSIEKFLVFRRTSCLGSFWVLKSARLIRKRLPLCLKAFKWMKTTETSRTGLSLLESMILSQEFKGIPTVAEKCKTSHNSENKITDYKCKSKKTK